MSSTILITGATGTQGSATIKALTTSHPDIKIHALTRDPSSSKAQSLASLSPQIQLFTGTHDDVPALTAAVQGCTAAFINVSPSFTDPHAETQHCSNILAALRSTPSTTRVVYSSVNGCADPTEPGSFKGLEPTNWMYGYFQSKYANENAVISAAEEKGWAWTILQPGAFLSNFLAPSTSFLYPQLATEHKMVTAFPPEVKLPYLDTNDIGRFAAAALASSDERNKGFKGKRIPLASVHLRLQDVADSMNAILRKWRKEGVEVRVEYLKEEEIEAQKGTNPLVGSQLFQAENPALVDLERVKGFGIELGSVEGFWEREKKRVEEAVGL